MIGDLLICFDLTVALRRSDLVLQIQKHIADSYAEYMAGKFYVYGVAADLDLSSAGNGLDADGTKLYCTTLAKNVADRAMQVGCGSGRSEQLFLASNVWGLHCIDCSATPALSILCFIFMSRIPWPIGWIKSTHSICVNIA